MTPLESPYVATVLYCNVSREPGNLFWGRCLLMANLGISCCMCSTGMLSKSLGQILRVSVAMHVLFCIEGSDNKGIIGEDNDDTNRKACITDSEADEDVNSGNEEAVEVNSHYGSEDETEKDAADIPLGLSKIVSKKAMKAAIDFVQVCCQHTAHIAGRGNITEELAQIEKGMGLYDLNC